MPLDVPDGAIVFLDANILAYAAVEDPDFTSHCRELLRRIEKRVVAARIAPFAMGDALHKIMLVEARLRLPAEVNVGRHLQKHPETVQSLALAQEAAEIFAYLPLELVSIDFGKLYRSNGDVEAAWFADQRCLDRRADAATGITHLATNDDDFDRVPGITVWKPRA
jgi:predicted nucleic acid-binding protein